jgi:hypothetical protein
MIQMGLDSSKIAAVGYADTRPIADNNSVENKAKNRRIEITIVGNPDAKSEAPIAEPEKIEAQVEAEKNEVKKAINAAECDAVGGKWQWNGTTNNMQCL